MAYDILIEQSPEALAQVEDLLAVMANETITDVEKDHPFVECAQFADAIKYKGGSWQSNWHFVDIPYFDKGGDAKDFPLFKFDEKNISAAIPGLVNWLMESTNYKDDYVYTTIMKYMSGNEQRGKSYAIRLLIHYLGDIHQPLHSLARVDSDYPSGDRGGNDFPVPSHYSTKELHAVWDSVMYEFHVNDKVVRNNYLFIILLALH